MSLYCSPATYCPLVCGMMVTSVRAIGQEGVWRLQNYDFQSSDADVKVKLNSEPFILQPEESEKYALIQLVIGKVMCIHLSVVHKQA